jgi:hypothetical protein
MCVREVKLKRFCGQISSRHTKEKRNKVTTITKKINKSQGKTATEEERNKGSIKHLKISKMVIVQYYKYIITLSVNGLNYQRLQNELGI